MRKVSIIIPCYNAEATVAETIDSALDQDVDLEVIAIDDGSVDGTADILRSYGDRITALFGPNRGVSAARNHGIDRACGEWIQFVDSDDLLTPGTLTQRLEVAESGADLIFCQWQEFEVKGGRKVDGRLKFVDRQAILQNPEVAAATTVWAPPAAILYSRNLVNKTGGFRPDLPVIQDARFIFDAVYHGAKIGFVDQIGARYRVVENSLSRRNPARFWLDVLLNGQQMEALWRSVAPLDEAKRRAVSDIYNQAARGLFIARHPAFFDAVRELRKLGPLPLHARLAAPLARVAGLSLAGKIFSALGRA